VVDKEFQVLAHLHRVDLVVPVVVVVEEPIAVLQEEQEILHPCLQLKDKMVLHHLLATLVEMIQEVAVVEQELQLLSLFPMVE
jgi:hypothetical protein